MNNAIVKLKVDKVFKTNQIFNRILKMRRKTMTKKLIVVFQVCIDVEYSSKLFRETKKKVVKKIKKRLHFSQSLQINCFIKHNELNVEINNHS